ncbi:MAG: Hg(II)-responsive transcriptional regulator [Ottowia sp.]|jgi:MerR family mercuric resistance operon transcriptional regulator|uniref:Hg(II)-responsive transcriptional regulator n=1 Tax=Piscinibacter defluvii TaxID=1796922 RepID=UPI000FDE6466|nr:Hg(II)-responsive transcriptional regulator [Piscinibacter defluvii]MCB1554844.1 Hg(II)-responsive transcriptional regulator [Xanthomonadales bacterium]MCB2068976.1 Hg(II)-responsive transcriptional regulator [Ottowia sp.]HNW63515.1 Hg(II)-responsive transcriptional regulator [Piscinibacter sp.]
MERDHNGLTIGAVAKAAGVNVETVRFYQRRALLAEPDKPYGGIRRYEAEDVARVKFVKAAQRLGFSLDEVAGLLKLDDGTHCDEARQLAEIKLVDVRKKLKNLRRIESVLASLVRDCCMSRGKVSCPLIDTLQKQ